MIKEAFRKPLLHQKKIFELSPKMAILEAFQVYVVKWRNPVGVAKMGGCRGPILGL